MEGIERPRRWGRALGPEQVIEEAEDVPVSLAQALLSDGSEVWTVFVGLLAGGTVALDMDSEASARELYTLLEAHCTGVS
jgi:hypothetical protein